MRPFELVRAANAEHSVEMLRTKLAVRDVGPLRTGPLTGAMPRSELLPEQLITRCAATTKLAMNRARGRAQRNRSKLTDRRDAAASHAVVAATWQQNRASQRTLRDYEALSSEGRRTRTFSLRIKSPMLYH